MPTGPQGQKRPADAVGAAVTVARIAVGELEEEVQPDSASPTQLVCSTVVVEPAVSIGQALLESGCVCRRIR